MSKFKRKLWLDLETYNEQPIKRGTYRYAETAEVMVIAWAIDDGEIIVEDVTDRPASLAFLIALGDPENQVIAHNAMFDRSVLVASNNYIAPDRDRWYCTMVQALSHGLPGKLDKLCEIFNLQESEAKHKEGHALVQLFCKPRPKNMKVRRATRRTHPEEWKRFLAYAGSDIRAMRVLHDKIPKWNYKDRWLSLWHLDQKINDTGFSVDLPFVRAAIDAVGKAQAENRERVQDITLGTVSSATKRDQLLRHILEGYGVSLPDLTADTLERRLNDEELPEAVKELIRLRLSASTSSTSKYKRLEYCASSDGKMRGTIQWRGAQRTGRAAGRNFQPQNLPRVPKKYKNLVEAAIAATKAGGLDVLTDDEMGLLSACIRGCIIAGGGEKLSVADLSNIEGRVLAWLAGEKWKLRAFEEFDKDPDNKALDLYIIGYSRSFGVPIEQVIADEAAGGMMRLIGKVQELALGYQGAVGAFQSMAEVYGVDVEESRALQIVKAWRKANPAIVSLWYEAERAAVAATRQPGVTVQCGKWLKFRRDGNWLRMALPSGRALCYLAPQVDDEGKLSYLGVDQYTRKWKRQKTYGGKLIENAAQAIANDVLADGMEAADEDGFNIVLHVHDEIISTLPATSAKDHKTLAKLMTTSSPWAVGLPLAAAGYTANRYRKG